MMRVLAIALAALTACTAHSDPQHHPLIPADAEFVFSVDVAAVLASSAFKPDGFAYHDSTPFVWLTAASACGVDPVQSHLAILGGVRHDGQLTFTLTGRDIGDITRLRCIHDRLRGPTTGPDPFTIHTRDHDGIIADHDLVATVVDPHTVVFATRPWAEPVHRLIHGEGPSHLAYTPEGRHAAAWVDGRPFAGVDFFSPAQRIRATFELDADLRIALSLDFDPTHAEKLRQDDEAASFCSTARMFGVTCETTRWTGDALHLDLTADLERFVVVAPAVFTNKPPPTIHLGGSC